MIDIPDYIALAIKHGQLEYVDDFLDDNPDSKTYGQYIKAYRATYGEKP